MDPQKIFGLITTGAAVLAIAGVVIVYLKSSVADATIKQLKENFGAMKESRDIEKARADAAELRIEKLEQADQLKDQQIKVLQEVATNRVDIDKVIFAINTHHEAAMKALGSLEEKVTHG